MNGEIETRLKEIDKLRNEIQERESRLNALLFPAKEVQVLFPAGFSLNNEILDVLGKAKGAVSTDALHGSLTDKYPKYNIDKKRVLSALAYLKNVKKEIESAGYGKYRVAPKPTTEVHSGSGG